MVFYSRFYESLLITQRKNEELICTLEDAGMQIERLECTGEGDPNSLMGIIDTLRLPNLPSYDGFCDTSAKNVVSGF